MELGGTIPARRSKWHALLGATCTLFAVVVVMALPRSSPTRAGKTLSNQEVPQGLRDNDLDGDVASNYDGEVPEDDLLEAPKLGEAGFEHDQVSDDLYVRGSDFPSTDFHATLLKVRKAVVPWSSSRTRYVHRVRFCTDGNVNKCSKESESGYFSRRRAGSLSARRTKVFDTDCSGFVGWALMASTAGKNKRAIYDHLYKFAKKMRPRRKRPLARDFYDAFDHQRKSENKDKSVPWKHVLLKDAQPGDVIAWHYPPGKKTTNTGHVMMVAKKPQYKGLNQQKRHEYWIEVADSTRTKHGNDSRRQCSNGECGLGFGTMAYETLENGHISGFQWVAGDSRRNSWNRNNFVNVGRFTR